MKNKEEQKQLDISGRAILKISLAVIIFYILYQIKDILILFLFSIMISVLFEPVIELVVKLKVPRSLAVVFVYIGFFGLLTLTIYLSIPVLISEFSEFSRLLPQYFEKISPSLKGLGFGAFSDLESFLNAIDSSLEGAAANILNILFMIFGGIFTTLFILTTAIFVSLENRGIEKTLLLLSLKGQEEHAVFLWRRCQKKIGSWFFTRIIGCLFVGAVSIVCLLVFNVKYSFVLGVIAGILNFIPMVGSFVAGALLFLTVSLSGLFKAVFVVIVFVFIQQVENNIVTPLLNKRFIDLSPVLVILAMAIGGTLWGLLGAVLAIPLMGIIQDFVKDFLKSRRGEAEQV